MPIASVNPATGETLRTFDAMDDAEVERRLALAHATSRSWRAAPVLERARVLAAAADILEREKDGFARTMTLEMGKPLRAAAEEVAKCSAACRYYAERAEDFVRPERIHDEGGVRVDVRYDPLGVVLAVMPWNFPFWQVIRFAAPALAAGNVGLLKHASNVPQCALALEDVFRRAGAPEGAFQALLVGSDRVGPLIADVRIAAATLTGSEGAGSKVAEAAGREIKKTVLELGGSDPFVVMPSADIALAARTAVKARTINNGQSCIAAKRFIVAEPVAEEFTRLFVDGMRALVVGDPMDASTDVGPLATADILTDIERQVDESVQRGARVLVGGRRSELGGNYYEPTILDEVADDSPAWREETFGPVAVVRRVPDMDAAIAAANDSTFGLGASVWTRDEAEADRFAAEIESGLVFFNDMVASDPRFPFGGVKRSGYGRELGPWGLREFVNVKTVRRRASGGGGTEAE